MTYSGSPVRAIAAAGERLGQRWGMTKGKIGFHGGKVDVRRPRVRSDGHEVSLPTWSTAQAEDWLGRWAMNLMLINVSTRKLKRAVRLPEGDLQAVTGDGTSKSAASRPFVALSAERMAEWMASDLSQLDLPVIQIDGLHIGNDLVLVGALGIDGEGNKQPLGLVEGATENAAVVLALIDNLIERGLDPRVCRLFIVDGAKALTKVLRSTFGRHTPIQRCRIHKARNVIRPSRCTPPCFSVHALFCQKPRLSPMRAAAETAASSVTASRCGGAAVCTIGLQLRNVRRSPAVAYPAAWG